MIRFLAFIFFASFMNIHLYAKPFVPRARRNAVKDRSRLWPKATVYYTLDPSYKFSVMSKMGRLDLHFVLELFRPNLGSSASTAAKCVEAYEEYITIRQAMKDIQSASCVQFKHRSDENAYVEIVKGNRCSADIGYWGNHQKLTLSKRCIRTGTVLHELFHTLGFYHEHARPDRDKYILVDENNVKSDYLHNFKKKSHKDVETFGLPYDFKSVLHYSPNAFAINKFQDTLKSSAGVPFTGFAEKLSITDIKKLNKLYRCHEKKTKSENWSKYLPKYFKKIS